MAKQATAAQKRRMGVIAELGCIICGSPACIHHTGTHLGGGRDHDKVIPLCPRHHNQHGEGISFHDNKTVWQEIYGTEQELIEKVERMLH